MTDTILIQPPGKIGEAVQIVAAGDPPALIQNPGPNTVFFGDTPGIQPTDQSGIVPLAPNGFLNTDGSTDLYVTIAAGQTQSLNLISGATNFFSPPSLSGLGGAKVFVQPLAPTQPPTIPLNSIWFNTTLNALEYWNGAAWVVQAFAGTELIQAGTIVANLIAAGIILAGVVDGTVITGATIIADGASGEILVYSSAPPALGNLIGSWSGLAGVDSPGNSFPAGLAVQQGGLVLFNQGSAPAPVSGASELYSSGGGRLRFLASAGYDAVIDRSSVNVAVFQMNTQTLPTIIGAPINYQPNEAAQSSEFEIEIDGIAVAPTSATGTDPTLTFGLAVDGVVLGAIFTVGSVFFPHGVGVTVNFTVRFRMAILNPGVSGTVIMAAEGSFNRAGTNAGNATNFNSTVGSNSGGTTKSFDTTSSHVIQPYANWSSVTSTGHSVATYITRQQRRD